MKRFVMLLLCLLVAMQGVVGEAPVQRIKTIEVDIEGLWGTAITQQAIYIRRTDGLYRWNPEEEKFELVLPLVFMPEECFPLEIETMNAKELELLDQYIMEIFSDGENLYTINRLTRKWAKLSKEEGLVWQDNLLDMSVLETDYSLGHMFVQNGFMYALVGKEIPDDQLENRVQYRNDLAIINLQTGEGERIEDYPIIAVCPYKDNKQLLLIRDYDEVYPTVAILDENRQIELIDSVKFPQDYSITTVFDGLAYDDATDTMYVIVPGTALASNKGEDFVPVAVWPGTLLPGCVGGVLMDGYLVAVGSSPDTGGVAVMQSYVKGTSDQAFTSLNIRGHAFIERAVNAFMEQSPNTLLNVDIAPLTPKEAVQMIQSGSEIVDIFLLRQSPELTSMFQKGYALNLDESAPLKEAANDLYPNVKATIVDGDGHLRAYPVYISAGHIGLDTPLWRTYLGDTPLPTTYEEFFSAFLQYLDANDEAEPDVYFVADEDAEGLLNHMVFQYIYQNETADKPLSFQSPALKAAINQLLTIAQKHGASGFTPQQILDTNIADEDIKPEMFFLNAGGLIGHFGENPDGASRLFPFTFEKDEKAILDGYLEVAVINPNSKRMAEALSFLEILSQKETNPVQYTLLHQNADQAVANPNAKEWLQALQEEVQLLEKAIEKANQQGNTQDVQQLNRELTVTKEAIEGGAGLWLMTEQEVQAYRSIQPQIKFFENSALLTENAMEQIRQSTKRLMGGQLTTDMFLMELDRIAKMVYAETR